MGGNPKSKTWASKKKAFDAALDTLVDKMRNQWTIVEADDDDNDDDENESSEYEQEEKPKRKTKKQTTTTKKKKKQKKQESESEQDDEDEYGSVLNGHLFVLSGSNQNARKKKIKDNGGNTKPSMSKQADFNNSKCKKAKELNIPIVTDQFIADCIKKDKFLSHKAYIVGDEDDEESEDEDMDKNKNNDDEEEEDEKDDDDDISMKDNDVPTTPKKAKKGNVFANKAFVISGSNQ